MINEKELQLVVSKQTLGTLTTNAKKIKENVEKVLVNFKAENYTEENIDEAKNDKAMLNNTAKKLNDERIRIEKEFMKPFDEFKDTVTEITKMIKETSSNIDEIVKVVENKAKESRRTIIEKIYEENIKELKDVLPLANIFDDKWLNKGSFKDENTFKLQDELISKIDTVRKDLITIGELHSKYEIELKNEYLTNFDLGEVIRKNSDLASKEEMLSKQQSESKEAVKEQVQEKLEEAASKVVEVKEGEGLETYILKIIGTYNQQLALRKFLKGNNFEVYKQLKDGTFEKCEFKC